MTLIEIRMHLIECNSRHIKPLSYFVNKLLEYTCYRNTFNSIFVLVCQDMENSYFMNANDQVHIHYLSTSLN